LDDVNSNDYKAIYYLGGRGPVIDLPDYKPNIKLAQEVRTTPCQRTQPFYTSFSFTTRESLLLPSAMALRK
jgi:hypothetical protein